MADGELKSKSNEVTLIKRKYLNQMPINAADLFKIMEDPGERLHERFTLSGYILGFSETKVEKIFKMLNQSTKKVTDINEESISKRKNSKEQDQQIINHFIVYFKDKSIENVNRVLNLYILTNDGQQNLFSLWDIVPSLDEAGTFYDRFKVGKKIPEFEDKMENITNQHAKASFVIELMSSKSGKAFCKIYDTIFLPY